MPYVIAYILPNCIAISVLAVILYNTCCHYTLRTAGTFCTGVCIAAFVAILIMNSSLPHDGANAAIGLMSMFYHILLFDIGMGLVFAYLSEVLATDNSVEENRGLVYASCISSYVLTRVIIGGGVLLAEALRL